MYSLFRKHMYSCLLIILPCKIPLFVITRGATTHLLSSIHQGKLNYKLTTWSGTPNAYVISVFYTVRTHQAYPNQIVI